MNATKMIVLGGFIAVCILNLGGCPAAPSRTNNQGGGNILTAGAKVAAGQLSTLTPDEVQIVSDLVRDVADNPGLPQITDEQAAAAVEFLQVNNLNTIADVQALVAEAAENPDSVVIPDSVLDLIEAGNLPDLSGVDVDDIDPNQFDL